MQLIPNHHSNKELKNCVSQCDRNVNQRSFQDHLEVWGSSLFQNVGTHKPIEMVSCPVPPTSWSLCPWQPQISQSENYCAKLPPFIWVQIWPHFSSLLLHMYLCCVMSSSPYFTLLLHPVLIHSHFLYFYFGIICFNSLLFLQVLTHMWLHVLASVCAQ